MRMELVNVTYKPIIKDYIDQNGKSGIYIRLTLNRKHYYYNTNLKIEKSKWDKKRQKVYGRTDEILNINYAIRRQMVRMGQAIHELRMNDIPITYEEINNILLRPPKTSLALKNYDELMMMRKQKELEISEIDKYIEKIF